MRGFRSERQGAEPTVQRTWVPLFEVVAVGVLDQFLCGDPERVVDAVKLYDSHWRSSPPTS